MSRTRNVKLNVGSALSYQAINLINNFLNRTFFVYVLGLRYLSLNSLFADVLLALSLADLGFSAAIGFSLYKPLAENDEQKVRAYMQLYKHAYRIIGIVVAALGISIIPYLPVLVNFDKDIAINYVAVYLIFLSNSVLSYMFFAYKGTIITAAQFEYKIVKINIFYTITLHLSQILSLFLTKNYYVYLFIPIVLNLLKNLLIARKAERLFPYMKRKERVKLEKKEKKDMIKNVYALALTKLSMIIYQVSDNIIISICINTIYVGIYSNYLIITKAINNIYLLIFSAFRSSIGNMNAVEDAYKKRIVFKRIVFFNYWLYGLTSIGLYELLNPLIRIWFGEKYLFSNNVVLMIALIFLIPGYNQTVTVYKDACGLFWQTRYRTILTALVNIVFSVVLAKSFGVCGVFIATIIAYIATIYPMDPRILYHDIFHCRADEYYLNLGKGLLITFFAGAMVDVLVKQIHVSNEYLYFCIVACIVLVVPNIIYCLFYYKTSEFQYYKAMLLKTLRKSYIGEQE